MADRILIWHQTEPIDSNTRIGPTFYMEADYVISAVRVYAVNKPTQSDAEFTIYDDGVSIFKNHSGTSPVHGVITYDSEATMGVLPKSANSDDAPGGFAVSEIAKGSWVYCIVNKPDSAKNVTIQLELEKA